MYLYEVPLEFFYLLRTSTCTCAFVPVLYGYEYCPMRHGLSSARENVTTKICTQCHQVDEVKKKGDSRAEKEGKSTAGDEARGKKK